MVRSVGRAIAVVGGYAGLVACLTWPLVAHLATHLPSPSAMYDFQFTTWALATETRTLATHPSAILEANIYAPAPHARGYGPTAVGLLPYFAPTFLATGNPGLAIDLAWLACLVLTAAALHLVVVRWTGSHLGGLVAGTSFLAAPWTLLGFLPVCPSYAPLLYFPLLLALLVDAAERRARGVVAIGVVAALQALADPIYVGPAVLGPLVVLGCWRLRRGEEGGRGLLVAAALAGAIVAPTVVPSILVARDNPHLLEQSAWTTVAGANVAPQLRGAVHNGLFAPATNLRAWYASTWAPTCVPCATLVLAGAGVVAGWRRRRVANDARQRAWRQALFWTASALVLAEPVAIEVLGARIDFPISWPVFGTPLYALFRQPIRFEIPALIGLTLLAGLGAAALVGSRGRGAWLARTLVVAALGWMLAEHYYGAAWLHGSRLAREIEYPLVEAIADGGPIVETLRREPPGPVIELPIGKGPNPWAHTRAMYRSIFHQHALLNGYGSYWPERFPERMDLARRLPDVEALRQLVAETGLAYVLVVDVPFRGPFGMRWRPLARRRPIGGLRYVSQEPHALLFAVDLP
jgi:hypothetical protein